MRDTHGTGIPALLGEDSPPPPHASAPHTPHDSSRRRHRLREAREPAGPAPVSPPRLRTCAAALSGPAERPPPTRAARAGSAEASAPAGPPSRGDPTGWCPARGGPKKSGLRVPGL